MSAAPSRLARARRRRDLLARACGWAATLAVLALLGLILAQLLWLGLGGLSLHALTTPTRPPGAGGGLANAIVGSAIQTALATLIGTPIGLLCGTWLAEYARASALASAVRFVADVLLAAPSILIGLFVYAVLVAPFGGFSALAGSVALAIIIIPIVVRATEDMLRLVPTSLREAAAALGCPRWRVVVQICWPAARQGIATGILLAIARAAGETAPLLFTSLGNLNWSLNPTRPMASLPLVIYQYAGSAFTDWVRLAWTAALLITLGVLALNLLARAALGGQGRPR